MIAIIILADKGNLGAAHGIKTLLASVSGSVVARSSNGNDVGDTNRAMESTTGGDKTSNIGK